MRLVSVVTVIVAAWSALHASDANAFCGFFAAKADAQLFNDASQVVLVRDEDKTVITMVNGYEGKVKEFAMVVPMPTAITRKQIHVGDMKAVDHLDAFTSVRLAEYFDPDPCAVAMPVEKRVKTRRSVAAEPPPVPPPPSDRSLGVTVEATYTVGEYDIVILSAKESDGLETWLVREGYGIPKGAAEVLASYIAQKNKFFVAKVNLAEHDKLGGGKLRPLQVAFESPKFMLPIRLGTVNAKGSQEIIVYAITRAGRVEATNYKTVKLPSDVNVPTYTKAIFGDFYKAVFTHVVEQQKRSAVVTEYAWDMSFCDPCAAEPLSTAELKSLGVWWIGEGDGYHGYGGQNAFVTRLHARYDRASFPEDLVFQVTSDRSNFQGRYVLQHDVKNLTCPADEYRKSVWQRQWREAKTLAELTGWPLGKIQKRMNLSDGPPESKELRWYERVWK